MATLPSWIQKENDQKARAAQKAEAATQQRLEAGNFVQQHSLDYWDQLAAALQSNAQALEKLEGEELHGSLSKSVTGHEHNLHIRVERRSVTHGPDFTWLNLWYIPGSGFMRCYFMDQMQPNIEFTVAGSPVTGREVLAIFDGKRLKADELAEAVVRQMAGQVRAKRRR